MTQAAQAGTSPSIAGGQTDGGHIVAKGESLSTIAKKYYGSPDWKKIHEANKPLVPNPDLVQPGLALLIPAAGEISQNAVASFSDPDGWAATATFLGSRFQRAGKDLLLSRSPHFSRTR